MRTWPRLCARGGGSEHLVRIILYLPGWLIGARALAWKRDAAIFRPREVSREKTAGVCDPQVGSSLTRHISRGVLSMLCGPRGGPTPRTQVEAAARRLSLQLELT